MTVSTRILLIDDEDEFLRSVSFTLRISGYPDVDICAGGTGALEQMDKAAYSLVLLDIMMPEVSGRELLPKIVAARPEVPVIMCTAVNEVESAVECIRAGAFDYMVKPIDKARLLTTVEKALTFHELKGENARLTESLLGSPLREPGTFSNIVTESNAMRSLFRYVEAIAPTSMPVLIYGETGSGKELFASALHRASGRSGPLVTVNVAGLDDTLFSDTLFGHERGAFTGAEKKREGLVAKATGGTLFLDEIGDLRIETQVKLLRLIEDRTYYPVGSDSAQRTDARIITATGVDLAAAVSKGTFRRDLFYRLKSHTIRIPPLRDRKEDLQPLVTHFLKQAAAETGKLAPTPPPQLYQVLRNYAFPGNVRELRGIVFDAVSRHTGGVMSLDVFKEHIGIEPSGIGEEHPETFNAVGNGPIAFGEQLPTLKAAEDALVEEAMKRCDNNQSQAARLLGITPSALNKRLNKA
jgi:two-component system nitrogen regulation response regulator GlnG